MKKIVAACAALALLGGGPPAVGASDPEADLKSLREFYMRRFPGLQLEAYRDGVYALNEDARHAWEAMLEFPPYEEALHKGKRLFDTPFANGKTYADCFPGGGIGIRQNYPYFDPGSGEVKTLEQEINECRVANGEKPLPGQKSEMAAIAAYMGSTANGKPVDIKVPTDDPRAIAWYEKGKQQFYAKRGQLNLSCANCHMDSAGRRLRAETLSPAIGHTAHFPVYRLEWGEIGTLQRRYAGCNDQVRAKPFPDQSPEYRALEYFHSFLSNGITVNIPGLRK